MAYAYFISVRSDGIYPALLMVKQIKKQEVRVPLPSFIRIA